MSASRARVRNKIAQIRGKGRSNPPAGFLYFWVGRVRRWKRRFCLATTPGVIVLWKGSSRRGRNWTINLKGATVEKGARESQFIVRTSEGRSVHLRCLSREDRQAWIDFIWASIHKFESLEQKAERGSGRAGSSQDSGQQQPFSDAQLFMLSSEEIAETRMQEALAPLQPEADRLTAHLTHIWGALQGLLGNMDLVPDAANTMLGHDSLVNSWQSMQMGYEAALRQAYIRAAELEMENEELHKSMQKIITDQEFDYDRYSDLPDRASDDGDRSSFQTVDHSPSNGNRGGLDEEYLDALEVLNQRDFYLRSASIKIRNVGGPGDSLSDDDDEEEGEGDLTFGEDEALLAEEGVQSDEDEGDEDLGVEYPQARRCLPAPMALNRHYSMWNLIKGAIAHRGDVTKLVLPTQVNEPLAGVQRVTEVIAYHELLDRAAACEDSVDRLLWVTAFAVSFYSGQMRRNCKPFAPILGETSEWKSGDGSVRFLSETVMGPSYPVTVWYSEGGKGAWTLQGEIEGKGRFGGNRADAHPRGGCYLKIPASGDLFKWNFASMSVNNLLGGFTNLWLDFFGCITVTNETTGEVARVDFYKGNRDITSRGECAGSLYSADGTERYKVWGNYLKEVTACRAGDEREAGAFTLFEPRPEVEDSERQYNFSQFTMHVNEVTDRLLEKLPPTDSKLREDVRLLEEGNMALATKAKRIIKNRDLQTRRSLKHPSDWKNGWFRYCGPKNGLPIRDILLKGESDWNYTGKYWEARERGDFDHRPDIFFMPDDFDKKCDADEHPPLLKKI